jgi:flavin reductase (DIM6/NTAB) family NADH-FMN oxidoreductase RutF
MAFRSLDPSSLQVKDLHQYILGMVSPRPIAFASTLDKEGRPNLAPYSFFNAFSSNPPILVFSSNRKVRDNTTKDTLHNIRETGEVVINTVSYSIMRQMSIASIEYPADVDEFEKAGFTRLPSDLVKPFRVAESPAHMECKVQDIITLGEKGGAGHLIICEVVRIHIREGVLDGDRIDPHRMDLVGRMGRAYYVRASGAAIHTLFQPMDAIGMGFDMLPPSIRHSPVLTGSELAEIAALSEWPLPEELAAFAMLPEVQEIIDDDDEDDDDEEYFLGLHQLARQLLAANEVSQAARALFLADRYHRPI